MLFCLCCSSIIETWLTGGMPTTTDWTQNRSERRRLGWSGGSVEIKKEHSGKKGLPERHAEISQHRQCERETDVEMQADVPAQTGYSYLLLDIAMGNRYGARWPVEEVLVRGHLTRLHRTPCTAQLLYRTNERKWNSSKNIFPFCYIESQNMLFINFYLLTHYIYLSQAPLCLTSILINN